MQNKRAEYGKQVIVSISEQLVSVHGKSFIVRNLRKMMQFAEKFPDLEIVIPVVSPLSWSHFLLLLPLKSNEARLIYPILKKYKKKAIATRLSNIRRH